MLVPSRRFCVFATIAIAPFASVGAFAQGGNADRLFRDDKLVGWGWNPGGDRSVPPVSRPAFVAAFEQWMRASAPCPTQ